jgi:ion channel
VIIHATGIAAVMRRQHLQPASTHLFWSWTWSFVRVAGWIILLHMLEITVWASFYLWKEAMPNLQAALYFSAVTYTTTGYGDMLLPTEWQLLGSVEALTGILMCGWSTGYFFAVVSRMFEAEAKQVDPTS